MLLGYATLLANEKWAAGVPGEGLSSPLVGPSPPLAAPRRTRRAGRDDDPRPSHLPARSTT
jgi:hypothetical protein